jgi:CDP-ribitol ribitolphosphotransferase
MHPFIKKRPTQKLDPTFFIDLSDRREINDLLMITDVLITDYSSVIFEAALLPITTIFFTFDLQSYIESRDFFYPFTKYTYGPVVNNEEDLIKAIKAGKIDEEKRQKFVSYFMSACDGNATQRFVNTVLGG